MDLLLKIIYIVIKNLLTGGVVFISYAWAYDYAKNNFGWPGLERTLYAVGLFGIFSALSYDQNFGGFNEEFIITEILTILIPALLGVLMANKKIKYFYSEKMDKDKIRNMFPFGDFLIKKTKQKPMISLEEALNEYIDEYGLAIRHSLDEPTTITTFRTKLEILEETLRYNPNFDKNEQVRNYIDSLRLLVGSFNDYSHEMLKLMKEKEKNVEREGEKKQKEVLKALSMFGGWFVFIVVILGIIVLITWVLD